MPYELLHAHPEPCRFSISPSLPEVYPQTVASFSLILQPSLLNLPIEKGLDNGNSQSSETFKQGNGAII